MSKKVQIFRAEYSEHSGTVRVEAAEYDEAVPDGGIDIFEYTRAHCRTLEAYEGEPLGLLWDPNHDEVGRTPASNYGYGFTYEKALDQLRAVYELKQTLLQVKAGRAAADVNYLRGAKVPD